MDQNFAITGFHFSDEFSKHLKTLITTIFPASHDNCLARQKTSRCRKFLFRSGAAFVKTGHVNLNTRRFHSGPPITVARLTTEIFDVVLG